MKNFTTKILLFKKQKVLSVFWLRGSSYDRAEEIKDHGPLFSVPVNRTDSEPISMINHTFGE